MLGSFYLSDITNIASKATITLCFMYGLAFALSSMLPRDAFLLWLLCCYFRKYGCDQSARGFDKACSREGTHNSVKTVLISTFLILSHKKTPLPKQGSFDPKDY